MRELRWASLDKRRPVVVLTRAHMLPLLRRVTVAPITSTVLGIPTEVIVDEHNGLDHESVISCDNVVTVPVDRIDDLVGHLDFNQERALREALLIAYDLDHLT